MQTNEVQRSWALVPAFLSLADERPLDLLELGPSGGLNLVWDRYRCVYSTGTWGSGTLELRGDDRTPPPASLFAQSVAVARRRGVDLNPVDVTTERRRAAAAVVRVGGPGRAARASRARRSTSCALTHRS